MWWCWWRLTLCALFDQPPPSWPPFSVAHANSSRKLMPVIPEWKTLLWGWVLVSHCRLLDGWPQIGLPSLIPLTIARIAGLHATKHKKLLEEDHGVQQSLWRCQGGGNVMSRHLELFIQEKVWLPSNVVFEMFESQKNRSFWSFGYLLGIR